MGGKPIQHRKKKLILNNRTQADQQSESGWFEWMGKGQKNQIKRVVGKMLISPDVYSYYIVNIQIGVILNSFEEMELRHKKPINSYKGQVSHDTNELYDEDFEKHAPQIKRFKQPMSFNTTSDVKKNAQILLEFINSMNEDYRMHVKNFNANRPTHPPLKRREAEDINQNTQRMPIENNAECKQLKPNKQQYNQTTSKNKKKHQTQPQKKNKFLEPIPQVNDKKTKKNNPQPPPPRQPQPLSNKQSQVIIVEDKKPKQTKKNQQVNIEPTKKDQSNMFNSSYQLPNVYQLDQNSIQMAQTQFLQMQMINLQNMAMVKPGQGITLQQLQQYQLSALYNQLGQMAFQNNSYIPFSNLSFLNQRNTAANSNKSSSSHLKPPPEKPVQKKQENKEKEKSIKIAENAKKQEAKVKEDQPVDSPPPDFKKRASYHVAIAYNIHYLQLKNRGKLPDSMNPDKREIDAIDPTYYAKKIREKKNTDEVHEVNNPKADDY